MDRNKLIAASFTALACATGATAQVLQHPFGGSSGNIWPGATIGEQHRYEMDRLRARSDQNDALARQQRLDTRLTLMELQARRQPAPDVAPTYADPALTLEQERARREAATVQRETTVSGVTQIDAWLDRSPR